MQRDWIAPPAAGLGLRIDGLRKDFGARTVLHGIDIDIHPGEFLAVVGRSGCGKSTLLRLLAGLDSPTGGQLRLDDAPAGERRDDVRMMFQEARLLPWRTVLQNVQLGLSTTDAPARARDALAQVGLADRADDWPSVLSGGQRQRVALARALVHRPRLLLLDEPLGALDALTRIEMQRLIESVWRERRFTAVLVTHDVAEAVALADRVLLIEEGRVTLDERVALARPRLHGSAAFAEIEGRVLGRVLNEAPRDAVEETRPRLVA
ncbi:MAG: ATP-binding cassette domain-containing protein [Vitreoscilla sp.]